MPTALKWIRPTIDTKFHIDMEWWQESGRDIHVYMQEVLCDECRDELSADIHNLEEVDWVDEETAEVFRVDALWHALRTCCSTKPDYITPNTPIIDAIFLTFLANGNRPLSVRELYERLDRRPPEVLLRILTGKQVYMGIRPVRD
ncbi:MAG: hypothetical protein H5T69_04830 [Chloroflexi bacterium]|nr:hypothetical protein [Chloroflexota bacterium]